ncbi:tigger transposable element-derived protein 6 [Nephila pilipes]|uniref:Tigger transposable element-derived protein 6 n=1 Tax=Nephila pilipes TaxID=299642 RepID=A0A8X6PZ33_NEPPI|nr:tigger transposable element-derived protein 6 [Nephila pilipes]
MLVVSLPTSSPLTICKKQKVNEYVEEWLEQGITRPSSSEYTSPVVLVKKKNGDSRICVYYRKLNHLDRFRLPLIDDVLYRRQDAKVYSFITPSLPEAHEPDLCFVFLLKVHQSLQKEGRFIMLIRHDSNWFCASGQSGTRSREGLVSGGKDDRNIAAFLRIIWAIR